MSAWNNTTGESKKRWDQNADYWDSYMGDGGNRFHRELVRSHTERLLDLAEGEAVLDIACGNGLFSRMMAELGARVTAVD